MNQRHLLAPSESDSVGGSSQVETGERGGLQFPHRVGREKDEGTQLKSRRPF